MKSVIIKRNLAILAVLCLMAVPVMAQRVLTLKDCRDMALENNNNLKISQEKVNMANYDKKIAWANYFPTLSMQGTYMHNEKQLQLLSDEKINSINTMGTTLQGDVNGFVDPIVSHLMENPLMYQIIMNSPELQALIQNLHHIGALETLNAIGQDVTENFYIDTRNVYAGMITIMEPVYAGGKIRAYNKMAQYAQDLAQMQLTTEQQEVIVTTDKAYWQIVSLANKQKLTEKYVELLRTMSDNVDKLVNEGMATNADKLSVKVKLNDAELSLIRVQNGVALSKMLLCQSCGLPLDTQIILADEKLEDVTVPIYKNEYSEEDIMNNRPELQSLTLAAQIYDKKVNIARSEFLPTVAVFGNYIVTNPSMFNGFEKEFHGMYNFGVVAKVPLFHFGEGYNKVRKAKSEAAIYKLKLEDTKELVMLQVSQYEKQIKEAEQRLQMTTEKMSDAEENLRMATVGFNEGMIPSSTLEAAQTAWMQAHSENIDAKIDVIMANTYLNKAVGNLK